MKIKILRATLLGGEHREVGEIVDWEGDIVDYLIGNKIVEKYVEVEPEKKQPAKKVSK